jgi:predicted Zn-dependent protease
MLYIFVFLAVLSLGGIVFLAKKRNLFKLRKSFAEKNYSIVRNGDNSKLTDSNLSEEHFISLIAEEPKNVEHYRKLGEWYAENNKKAYAVKTLKHAVKLNPKDKKLKKLLAELQS